MPADHNEGVQMSGGRISAGAFAVGRGATASNVSGPPVDDPGRQEIARRLTELLQLRDEPTAGADRAFAQTLFGLDHPYGRPLGGSEATTRATTRWDPPGGTRRWYTCSRWASNNRSPRRARRYRVVALSAT